MKTKKILKIIADTHSPDARLQKEITSLFNNGYKIDVACWDRENDDRFKEKEINFHGIVRRFKLVSRRGNPLLFILNNIRFYFFVLSKISNKSYDVFHVHSIQVLPLGIFLKLLYRKPLVYDVHEITETFGNHLFNGLGKIFFGIEKHLVKFVDLIITATYQLNDKYRPFIRSKTNIITLLNCLPYREENFCIRNYEKENEFVIGRIGNLRMKSRIDIVSQVITQLKKRKNNIKFILSGANIAGYEKISEKAIQDMGEIVEYHNWISLEDFKKYYERFHLVINIHEKGDPLEEKYACFSKVYESISFGVPVIINDFPTMTDFVEKNGVGIVIPELTADNFVKKIEDLINNPSKLAEMQLNCHKIAKEVINWQKMEQQLIQAYKDLIP